MSEQFTEVSEQGLGSNLMDSIKGVAVGGLLFILSFPVLWWNEGRTDLSSVAKRAQIVKVDAVDKAAEGKLVSLTGALKSDGKLGDPQFLQPGDYVRLVRTAEMFAWVEHKESKTEKKLGGGKKTETTYSYDMAWATAPKDSSSFRYPEGHENPQMAVKGEEFSAKNAILGAYHFNPGVAEMPGGEALKLTADMIKAPLSAAAAPAEDEAAPADGAGEEEKEQAKPAAEDEKPKKAVKKKKGRHGRRVRTVDHTGGAAARRAAAPADRRPLPTSYRLDGDRYLFRGKGAPDRPVVGDLRISFNALLPGAQMTLFGEPHGDEVVAHSYKDDERLFRALRGDHKEAIQTLATEHKVITWVLRAVGWLLMWFGLMMFFGPINAFLDIIPFLGSAGRFLVGLVTLPISLLLSTTIIILSIIAHSPILLVLTLAGLGAGGYFLYQRKKKKAAA